MSNQIWTYGIECFLPNTNTKQKTTYKSNSSNSEDWLGKTNLNVQPEDSICITKNMEGKKQWNGPPEDSIDLPHQKHGRQDDGNGMRTRMMTWEWIPCARPNGRRRIALPHTEMISEGWPGPLSFTRHIITLLGLAWATNLLGGRARMLVLTWVLVLSAAESKAHPTVHGSRPPRGVWVLDSILNAWLGVFLSSRNSIAPQRWIWSLTARARGVWEERRGNVIKAHGSCCPLLAGGPQTHGHRWPKILGPGKNMWFLTEIPSLALSLRC